MNSEWIEITRDMVYGTEEFSMYFIRFYYEEMMGSNEYIFDGLLHFEKEETFSRYQIKKNNLFIEQKNIIEYDHNSKLQLIKDIRENKYTFIINFGDNRYPKVYLYSLQNSED